jgi:hypothetical protein
MLLPPFRNIVMGDEKNQGCHPNLCTSMIHTCLEESRVVTEAAECAMTCQLVVSTLRHDDASWDLGHPEPWHQRQLDRRHSAAIQGVVVVHAATPCSVLTVFWMPSMVTQREPRQDLCDSIHHKLPSKSLRRHMKRGVIFICSLSL